MKEITVPKDALLAKLMENRDDHRAIFEEALAGYEAESIEELQQQLDLLRAGKRRDIRIIKAVPRDHTNDYNRAIAMIEMSMGDTVTLSEMDFAQYVMDDWGWQGEFLSNAYRSGTASAKFGDRYVVS